jgi:hypothetical protein
MVTVTPQTVDTKETAPPVMEGSYKYTESAVSDSGQKGVLPESGLNRGIDNSSAKEEDFMKIPEISLKKLELIFRITGLLDSVHCPVF